MPKTDITKTALGVCLKELMKKKRLGQITVKDITSQCGVSRNVLDVYKRQHIQGTAKQAA